jgi:pimeloyl-ACP methyl ester carboxylesterase
MRAQSGVVRSSDGTVIAYDRAGSGPAVILVDAAGHFRQFSSFDRLVDLLVADFTVLTYDRRGRGASTDTAPYAVEREVDDLAALIHALDGSAFVYAFSSGGLLGLHAASIGLPIPRMALLEPPIEQGEHRAAQRAFTAGLSALVDANRADEAVEYYLAGIGVPGEILAGMRDTAAWSSMTSVAATLVYDCRISEATSFDLLATVPTRTLVLDSMGSSDDLAGMAAAVAAALPRGESRSLPGEWHGVDDVTLASVLREFFLG